MATLSGTRADRTPMSDRQVDSSVDLLGLGETILRRRWTIAICVCAFVALAVLLLTLISPRYTATSQILIDPREQRVLQNEVVQQGLGGDMALVDSQIKVITSEAVLGRVVSQAHLESDLEFVPASQDGRKPSEVALESLAKATKVTRPENTYVLEIGVTTKEPTKSARLANAIAVAYVADRASSASAAAREVSSAIYGRLAELRTQLREAEEKVAAFKREHNVSQSEGQLLGDRKLTDLSARQAAAVARVNDTRSRLQVMQDAMRTRGSAGVAAPNGNGTMGTLRIRLEEAKRQLAELQQVLGPRHPRVTAARAEVAQAEDAIQAESKRMLASAQDDYKAAVDTLAKVNTDLEAAKTNSFSTNEDLIKLHELEREAQSSKVVYESFLVRAKETAQQENITARTARIIADAAVPAFPSFPPKMILLAAAGLLGLFFGIFLAILLDLGAGLRAGRSRASLPVPATEAQPALDELVLVTAMDDPDMARQAALDLALGSMSDDHHVLFMDLAADAPVSGRGLAEVASEDIPLSSAILIAPESGLHILGAGRAATAANVSRDMISNVIKTVAAEYDEVVVNIGELDGERTMPASVAVELTRHAVLVVKGHGAEPREKQVVEALSNNGAVSVSLVSIKAGADLYQVA